MWEPMKHTAAFFLLAAMAACSGVQGTRSDIPAAARPLWDQCTSAVNAWCERSSQGDPTRDRECKANVGHDYSAIPDDAGRRQFLSAHGCAL